MNERFEREKLDREWRARWRRRNPPKPLGNLIPHRPANSYPTQAVPRARGRERGRGRRGDRGRGRGRDFGRGHGHSHSHSHGRGGGAGPSAPTPPSDDNASGPRYFDAWLKEQQRQNQPAVEPTSKNRDEEAVKGPGGDRRLEELDANGRDARTFDDRFGDPRYGRMGNYRGGNRRFEQRAGGRRDGGNQRGYGRYEELGHRRGIRGHFERGGHRGNVRFEAQEDDRRINLRLDAGSERGNKFVGEPHQLPSPADLKSAAEIPPPKRIRLRSRPDPRGLSSQIHRSSNCHRPQEREPDLPPVPRIPASRAMHFGSSNTNDPNPNQYGYDRQAPRKVTTSIVIAQGTTHSAPQTFSDGFRGLDNGRGGASATRDHRQQHFSHRGYELNFTGSGSASGRSQDFDARAHGDVRTVNRGHDRVRSLYPYSSLREGSQPDDAGHTLRWVQQRQESGPNTAKKSIPIIDLTGESPEKNGSTPLPSRSRTTEKSGLLNGGIRKTDADSFTGNKEDACRRADELLEVSEGWWSSVGLRIKKLDKSKQKAVQAQFGSDFWSDGAITKSLGEDTIVYMNDDWYVYAALKELRGKYEKDGIIYYVELYDPRSA